MMRLVVLVLVALVGMGSSFQTSVRTRYNQWQRLALDGGDKDEPTDAEKRKPSFMSGLVQLMTMGAGAPSLGEYKYTDERGTAFFELEGNNLIDSEGNSVQMKAKFFENGWTEDSKDALGAGKDKPPGFFENLFSGGTKQTEWDMRNRKSK